MRIKKGVVVLKERLRLALLLVVTVILMLPSGALAEAGISVECTPNELTEPGKVRADVVIKNTSDSVTMEDVTIAGPKVTPYVVGNIAPLGSRPFTIMDVQIDELGKAVNFTLTWTEGGVRKEAAIPVLPKSKNVTPKLIATRTADKEILKPGESATLTYVIQNQGEVGISDIKITDPALTETVAEGLSLEVGAEAKTVTKQVTMGDAPLKSEPFITYTAAGKAGELKVEPLEIKLAQVMLDVALQAVETTATGTKVAIVLTNNGNLGLSSLKITDELGNEIRSGIDLAPGEASSVEHVVASAAVRRFQVSVAGTDAQNQPFTFQGPQTLELKPMIDPSGVQLTFTATADTSKLDATGKADITFNIRLDGNVALTEAVIIEETLGDIMTLGVLNSGEVTKVQSFDVTNDTQFRFSVKAVDAAGNPYIQAAKTLDITLSGAEPPPYDAPAETPEPKKEGTPIQGQGTLLTLIIVIGVLLVAAVVALGVLLVQDRRGKDARQDEMDELEEMLESPKLSAKKPIDDDDWDDDFGTKSKFKLPRVPAKPSARPSQGLPEGFTAGTQPQAPTQAHQPARPSASDAPFTSSVPARDPAKGTASVPAREPAKPSAPKPAPPRTAPAPQERHAPAPQERPVAVRPAAPVSQERPRPVSSGVQPPYQPPILPSHDSGWDELDDDL